jgi:hypothetical protein
MAGVLCAAALLCGLALSTTPRAQPGAANAPAYTADGRLQFPAAYRKWVYLSAGFDMSYLPSPVRPVSTFGNVFVNPEAYDAFIENGTWPDKTVLVLEVRRAEPNASINRFAGWAFFAFPDEMPAAMIPRTANCYSCHEEHAAVDTTFVQFYPTLLAIARSKNTLTAHYLAEDANAARK